MLSKMNTQSIDVIQKILEPKGYSFDLMQLGERRIDFMQITSPAGKRLILANDNPLYPFATSSARLIYSDKLKSYEFVKRLGVTTPNTYVIHADQSERELDDLQDLFKNTEKVIVKPHNSEGSKGLSLDITNFQDLQTAIKVALEVSTTVLIQTQFIGEEIRFVTVNGRVKAALLRKKPMVIGDGISSIADLIKHENEERAHMSDTMVAYPQLDDSLISSELLNSTRIPEQGERVELNKKTMIRGGASMYNVLDEVNPEYIAIVEKIALQFGSGFLAVDFMLKDYTTPASSDNYVFLETNVNPALSLFYSCRDGRHVPIAEEYLVPLLERAINLDE